jgi:hypothetical protein
MQGHRGSEPQNPDVLCTQTATDRLVSFWYYSMCLCINFMIHLYLVCLPPGFKWACDGSVPLSHPYFKGQSRVHLICAPRKNNTYNNRVHRDKCHKYHKCTYYIAEFLQNK